MAVEENDKKKKGKRKALRIVGKVIGYGFLAYLLSLVFFGIERVVKGLFWSTKEPVAVFISTMGEAATLDPINFHRGRGRDYFKVPDSSKVVFSKKITCRYYIRPSLLATGKRFRIFVKDPNKNGEKELVLRGAAQKVFYDLGSEDHVAPLVSPDGKKIAFAVTRKDHPSTIYVIRADGTNPRRITPWYDSLAFAWLSAEKIVFWASPCSDVDLSEPANYKQGRSFSVNVEDGKIQELTGTPTRCLEIKYVSSSKSYELKPRT